MASLSYSLSPGQAQESIVAGTLAPNAGIVEVRINQNAAITDASYAGGTRAATDGEVVAALQLILSKYVTDPNRAQ